MKTLYPLMTISGVLLAAYGMMIAPDHMSREELSRYAPRYTTYSGLPSSYSVAMAAAAAADAADEASGGAQAAGAAGANDARGARSSAIRGDLAAR